MGFATGKDLNMNKMKGKMQRSSLHVGELHKETERLVGMRWGELDAGPGREAIISSFLFEVPP